MASDLKPLYASLGYAFTDEGLPRQALTHRSAGVCNNERLEFLGDAVLGAVIAEWLYRRHPDASEGQLTRWRASLVQEETLAEVARDLDLGAWLALGGGEMKSGGRDRDSILSDALEAVIGAIFLEAGLEGARQRVVAWFEGALSSSTFDGDNRDSKTRLQEYLQGRRLPLPDYQVVATEGDPHQQLFTVVCRLPGIGESASAKAFSRKKAEKQAAEKALKLLMDKNHE